MQLSPEVLSLTQDYGWFAVGTALLIVLGVAAWYLSRTKTIPGEEKPMSRKEYEETKRKRKERIKSELADDIGDAILNRMTKGDWTNEEGRGWALRLGIEFNISDLLPQRRLSIEEIKAGRRIRIETLQKAKRPNIPGEPPLQDNRNFKNPLEAIFAKHFSKPAIQI